MERKHDKEREERNELLVIMSLGKSKGKSSVTDTAHGTRHPKRGGPGE